MDLIFTMHPNVLVESGVHSSLHPNCHHQVLFQKFNLQIYHSPPYLREIWHYKHAKILDLSDGQLLTLIRIEPFSIPLNEKYTKQLYSL